jgi:hypothetical protein
MFCVLATDGTPEYVNAAWTAFSGLDLEGTARAGVGLGRAPGRPREACARVDCGR